MSTTDDKPSATKLCPYCGIAVREGEDATVLNGVQFHSPCLEGTEPHASLSTHRRDELSTMNQLADYL